MQDYYWYTVVVLIYTGLLLIYCLYKFISSLFLDKNFKFFDLKNISFLLFLVVCVLLILSIIQVDALYKKKDSGTELSEEEQKSLTFSIISSILCVLLSTLYFFQYMIPEKTTRILPTTNNSDQ
jgi:hypothetical protein